MSVDGEGSEVSDAELALGPVWLTCTGPEEFSLAANRLSPVTDPPLCVMVPSRECLQARDGSSSCTAETRSLVPEPCCSEAITSPSYPAATRLVSIEPCCSLAPASPGCTSSAVPSWSPPLFEGGGHEFVEVAATSTTCTESMACEPTSQSADASCLSVTSSIHSQRSSASSFLPGSPTGPGCYARPWARSPAAAAEYASFDWPLTDVREVRRLLATQHLRPTWRMLGDASASWTCQMETTHGIIALVVDRRELRQMCLGYRGSFQDVLLLQDWDGICGWPSCTHQAVSNAGLLRVKEQDGRMFFGMVGVLYALFAGSAKVRMVEQPVTVLNRYFPWPTQRLRTSAFGDTMDKTICLRMVGLSLKDLATFHRDPIGPLQSRLPIWAFDNAEQRDEYRSSWSHFPLFLVALASCLVATAPSPPLSFAEAVEQLAVACYKAGMPVPPGYDAPDGLPPTVEAREYQLEHGKGHGIPLRGIVPRSLRVSATTAVSILTRVETPDCVDSSMLHEGSLMQLAAAQQVLLASLTAQGFMLFFMSVVFQPLVYAPLSGLHVIGAELPLPLAPTRLAMPIMEHWAEVAWGAGTAATTFLIGCYNDGPRLGVATLPFVPPESAIVRTPQDLRRARRSRAFAWCTLAALALLPVADPASRAFAGVEIFIRPVSRLSDFASDGKATFRFGARALVSMDPSPRLMLASTPTELLLARDAANAILLRQGLAECERGPDGHLFEGWAEQIRPLEVALHDELAALLPDFSDAQLRSQPFSAPYTPPDTSPLPRAPLQPTRSTPFCVRSPFQMLLPSGQRRLEHWLEKIVDQLRCVEAGEPSCELLRPQPIAIGQGALLSWARGIVWDFTFERADCAVPLDFALPLESGLNLDPNDPRSLSSRLHNYPDRRLFSYLTDGVRFEADVELQTVLVPHLVSLPKGFQSVRKELYRLHARDWYRFFNHPPFWPMYFNGQGAAARKLSERYRRTTECGGPRKPTYDETGLAAISINDATATQHFPEWFRLRQGEAVWEEWLLAKGLSDPATHGRPAVLPPETKPTLADVMRDLSVLLAAARLLEEPIYIFGDDARDHFNQLAISSEDWNRLGVVFLHEPSESDPAASPQSRLFFVSERRLGFGAKISSNVAQRFSEAVLALLREDMDAVEAAQAWDGRPSMDEWRRSRRDVATLLTSLNSPDLETEVHHQTRLYFAKMYTDDAILGVVGVQRALRLLGCWQRLMADIGLEMAPPAKRTIGTWVPWLGVIVCAGLGLIVVPAAKLLRTTERLLQLLAQPTEFSEYRSLMGMLEHLRCINQAPSSVMYGLYAPHRSRFIRESGPSTFVRVNVFMHEQLSNWIELVSFTGGAPVTAVLMRAASIALQVVISSDAATDSAPPGIGGYCHGLYWYLHIRDEWLEWLHITVLELLATGGSALAFEPHTRSAQAVVLQSDALATPYVLTRHKSRSLNLAKAHHLLLRERAFCDMAWRASIAHLFGDCNPFSDAISRSLWRRFYALCSSVGVRPVHVKTPPRLVVIIETLVAYARACGEKIKMVNFARSDPVIPPAMLGLGRLSAACEEADAVSISRRLHRHLHPGEGDSEQAPVASVLPAEPAGRAISLRLASVLNMPAPAGLAPRQHLERPSSAPGPSSRLAAILHMSAPSELVPQPVRRPPNAQLSKPEPAQPHKPARQPVKRLSTEVIAGMRVLALPASLAAVPTAAKKRKACDLRAAAQACAATRAAGLASAGFANSPYGMEQLTKLLQHAVDISDFGSSHSTQSINETAWQHWLSFATLLDFNPIFTIEQVRDHQSHIGTLMATFLLFIYPKMKGKQGRQWAKPRSAFAYVLAIIRIFRGWKLLLPSAKVVKGELHGLLRAFVQVHGVTALMPRRREPFTYNMVVTMQRVTMARLGARSYTASSHIGRAFRGILAVGWRTGHRLAEFVRHPSGDLCYLTRGDISYIIAGVTVADPTLVQLLQMRPGDAILIRPPRSKTDPFGEIHCPFPSTVPYRADPDSAGFILRQLELDDPCRGSQRDVQPLFADESGLPYTHSVLDTLLDHMLRHCFGAGSVARHSWHSMRIGLATALKAANVSDDIIQMICRWMNPESLRAYARHGQSLHINCVDQAEHAVFDSIQSANVPKVCNSEGNAALHLTFAPSISKRAQAVLDAAEDAATVAALPPSDLSPLDARACIGRRVLVPCSIYPTEVCSEHGGRGWAALIVHQARGAATLRFVDAANDRGIPYENVQLQLAALSPL